jgi:hypothetical protein
MKSPLSRTFTRNSRPPLAVPPVYVQGAVEVAVALQPTFTTVSPITASPPSEIVAEDA